ncbi:hypothetical protein N4G70_30075 [Streptomyces sp. ASQP_92]|uniref:hypothetical protein n=1 Tax=Streptomyces sp. ASQP_92 TaxID=2979116 RepID=UPI0021BF5618|nr:hypothetical protein [Streptomyces sp. ASQP_92]MCT9093084.1 hypothetical protein [Streptomyces sp. ASQP_92]
MRARTPRRLAAVALSTAIVIATAGAAAAEGVQPPRPVRAEAAVPGADGVLQQVKVLADLGGVLKPVTDLVTGALGGKSPAEVTALASAATSALDAAKSATPAALTPPKPVTPADPATPATPPTPATPATPAAPAVPAKPAVPESPAKPAAPAPPAASVRPVTPANPAAPTPALSELPLSGAPQAAGPVDVRADAVAVLKKSVDDLVKAVTGAKADGVVPAATSVVTGLVGLVVATLVGAGLPVPSLPGLPQPPKSPAGSLPAAPGLPA